MDPAQLKENLIQAYSEAWVKGAQKTLQTRSIVQAGPRDQRFIESVARMVDVMDRYQNDQAMSTALEKIDLAKIYAGVDRREDEATDGKWGYDDHLVMEALHYFKHDFFKWVNKPPCTQCHEDGDNMVPQGGRHWSTSAPNPDQVSVVELYRCRLCNVDVEFKRINNATTLLTTRRGRCGEFVNCFLLILAALLGGVDRLRYIWNQEDHVWCEYYSTSQKRWIHLDPCEAVIDEPLLYCNNWGKAMSYVLGFGSSYCIDLSSKYIAEAKQIAKTDIVDSPAAIDQDVQWLAFKRLLGKFARDYSLNYRGFYYEVLVRYNQERKSLKRDEKATTTQDLPQGRQLGSADWTRSRGEAGQ